MEVLQTFQLVCSAVLGQVVFMAIVKVSKVFFIFKVVVNGIILCYKLKIKLIILIHYKLLILVHVHCVVLCGVQTVRITLCGVSL
jgi:hypothetical protein